MVAAVLTRWLGDATPTAAVLVGLVVLLIYAVLLGMFWTAPVMAGGHDDHHGHDHHGHDGHGHAAVAEPAHVAEVKPVALAAPRGKADDLQVIEGIGPVLEQMCHDLGIYHYDQIAAWGEAEVAWMDSNLKGFKGRVSRDKWVRQAKLIGEIGLEPFKIRAKTNDY